MKYFKFLIFLLSICFLRAPLASADVGFAKETVYIRVQIEANDEDSSLDEFQFEIYNSSKDKVLMTLNEEAYSRSQIVKKIGGWQKKLKDVEEDKDKEKEKKQKVIKEFKDMLKQSFMSELTLLHYSEQLLILLFEIKLDILREQLKQPNG